MKKKQTIFLALLYLSPAFYNPFNAPFGPFLILFNTIFRPCLVSAISPISSLRLRFLATGSKDSKICATLFVTTSIVYFKYFVMSCLQSKPSPLPLSNHCLNRYSTFSPSRPVGRIQIQYKYKYKQGTNRPKITAQMLMPT